MSTSRPLRILHLIDSGGLYGAEKVLLALASECRNMGHDPIVGTMVAPRDPGDSLGHAARQRGLRHVAFHMSDGIRIGGLREILRFARREAVDIVHTHGYRPNIMLAMVPRRFQPCPIITTLHGWTATRKVGKLPIYEALERALLPRLDRVVIVSETMRHRLPRRIRLSATLIPNGIEIPSDAKVAHHRIQRGAGEPPACSRPVVLAAGRLSFEKGFDVLLDAIAQLRDEGVTVDVLIAGDGPEDRRLRTQSEALGLQKSVRFLGFVKEMGPLFAMANLLVLPSRTEGLPLVLLEAMAAEVPVVATNVGQVPEVLVEGRCGLAVPPESAAELSKALRATIEEPGHARRRAELAKTRLLATYSANAMATLYASVYSGLA